MVFRRTFIFLTAACLMLTVSGLFAAPLETGAPKGGPINIEADRMESNQQENVVYFSGNVEARQDDLTILADHMTVHYTNGAKDRGKDMPPSQSVDKIVSEGNVRMKRENWTASADRMEYREGERKVVLTGNTKVWQNNNMVTGDRIELFLDEGRSVVEGGKKEQERVKAFFYPEASANGQEKKK